MKAIHNIINSDSGSFQVVKDRYKNTHDKYRGKTIHAGAYIARPIIHTYLKVC